MYSDSVIEQLIQTFQGRKSFSREELFEFYRKSDPELNENTFRWRIYDLKNKNIISPLSRKYFTLKHKPAFVPVSGENERKLASQIRRRFSDLKLIVWSTRIIHEFMLHQPGRYFTIVEVEREALEPVFYFLRDNNVKYVFLEPDKKEIGRYIYGLEHAVIVLPLVSKSPVRKNSNLTTVTIEKLLVDLFSNEEIFSVFQGNELVQIFNTAYSRYAIDFTKLLSYSTRRRKVLDLKDFISRETEIPINIFND